MIHLRWTLRVVANITGCVHQAFQWCKIGAKPPGICRKVRKSPSRATNHFQLSGSAISPRARGIARLLLELCPAGIQCI